MSLKPLRSEAMNDKPRRSVLFVCMGNICRSPTAEGVFRHLLGREAPELDVEIDSAGTHAYHIGDQPDQRAQAAAIRRGIDLSTIRARKVSANDFSRFDLILAMDEDNLALLVDFCPPDQHHKLRLFLEYAVEAGVENVPDPYYGGANGFEQVLDLVEVAALGLISELRAG